jgi:lactoylglutathione lyase
LAEVSGPAQKNFGGRSTALDNHATPRADFAKRQFCHRRPGISRVASGPCLPQIATTAATAMVKKLLHTRYRVNDLEKTVAFYREVLGLEEIKRHKSPRGSELVFLRTPNSDELIEICSFPASGPVSFCADLTHLAFEVDDLEAFARHAAACGCPLSDGPTESSSGRFAFIDAPEGYEIELIEYRK